MRVLPPDEARELVEHDWLITRTGDFLHHAILTDDQADDLWDWEGPLRLSCGRVVEWVGIPGIGERLSAKRCARCGAARGYPPGIGSPKNDNDLRRLNGWPVSERETVRAGG